MAIEREEKFNEQDLHQLKGRRRLLVYTTIAGIAIIGGIGIFLVQVLMDIEYKLYLQVLLFAIAAVGFSFLGLSNIRKYDLNVKNGKKTVLKGVVTNKRSGGNENRNTKYLEIETVTLLVKREVYNKYEIGDNIEVHFFKPSHDFLLYDTKVEPKKLDKS